MSATASKRCNKKTDIRLLSMLFLDVNLSNTADPAASFCHAIRISAVKSKRPLRIEGCGRNKVFSHAYVPFGVIIMNKSATLSGLVAQPAFLSKERIIAKPGFNRWLVPPAALAIHLCIGMAYGFSVFWIPLSKAVGITASVACAPNTSFLTQVFSSSCDWPIS
ncbi:hypothetical protein QN380_24700, partial [Pseudomonas sp. MH10]|nr:hypothetical protein [Pseudomonas sp. MH10]